MICKNFILCLQETTWRVGAKKPEECFLNLPCGCPQPGKGLQCEECPYLEACLSQFKPLKRSN